MSFYIVHLCTLQTKAVCVGVALFFIFFFGEIQYDVTKYIDYFLFFSLFPISTVVS